MADSTLLQVRGLRAAYGDCQALFGVDLDVREGEVVTLLGRNGMGKTTTVMSLMGLRNVTQGEVSFRGAPIRKMPAHKVARLGFGLVPEGRRVFRTLTVEENLVATARTGAAGTKGGNWTLQAVLDLFPSLQRRLSNFGNQLSGGEQQMLAVSRALLTNPQLLILDEATEGLAPIVRQEIWSCLARLKAQGQSILVIDKNIQHLIRLADRHYVLEKGLVVWEGTSTQLQERQDIWHRYLGV